MYSRVLLSLERRGAKGGQGERNPTVLSSSLRAPFNRAHFRHASVHQSPRPSQHTAAGPPYSGAEPRAGAAAAVTAGEDGMAVSEAAVCMRPHGRYTRNHGPGRTGRAAAETEV